MPKTRKRRKGTAQRSTIGTIKPSAQNDVQQSAQTTASRRPLAPSSTGPTGLIWPALVSLGCWGMAVSFFFFSNDPNHVLFGSLVVIMALLWTLSFVVRVRKLRAVRQK